MQVTAREKSAAVYFWAILVMACFAFAISFPSRASANELDADEAKACVLSEVSEAVSEVPSSETKKLLEKQKISLSTTRGRVWQYIKNKKGAIIAGIGSVIIGSFVASYTDEGEDWYNEHLKKHFRRFEKRLFLIPKFGGRKAVDAIIEQFKARSDLFASESWASLDRTQQRNKIDQRETDVQKFFQPLQPYSGWEDQDLKSQKKLLRGLADQVLVNESIYAQARAQLSNANISKQDRRALEEVARTSQSELDRSVTLWKTYLAASPSSELDELEPDISEKFNAAADFVLTNTDLTLYRKALVDRSNETIKALKDIVGE
jgi:hypothetical protein